MDYTYRGITPIEGTYTDWRDARLRHSMRGGIPQVLDAEPYVPECTDTPFRGQISYYRDPGITTNPYYRVRSGAPLMWDEPDPMGGVSHRFYPPRDTPDASCFVDQQDAITFRNGIYDGYVQQLRRYDYFSNQ